MTTFDPCLVVLNPRRIPDCIRSLERLHVPKIWLTAYTERQLTHAFPQAIDTSQFTHYVLVSDDVIAAQPALDSVLTLLAQGHPVVTGWTNLDQADPRINLGHIHGTEPAAENYTFITRHQLALLPDPAPTEFAGMCLTGMSREHWQQYPLDCYGTPGYGSDYHLCTRLKADGIPILAPHNAGVHHVKERWNHQDKHPSKQLTVGHTPPQTRIEPGPAWHSPPSTSSPSTTPTAPSATRRHRAATATSPAAETT